MSLKIVADQPTVPEWRSHRAIVKGYGAQKLRALLISKGFDLPNPSTAQRWVDRGSIPSDYWNAIAEEGIASLEELAGAADPRKVA